MKRPLFRLMAPLVWSLGSCLLLSSTAHAQSTPTRTSCASSTTQRAVVRRVRAFYAWWGAQVKRGQNPLKNRAMVASASSRRLTRWLYSPAFRDYDADYFMQAQDYDQDWDQARISNVSVTGNVARLSATLGHPKPSGKGIGERKLHLRLVKEGGVWKIDQVTAPGE